jgi:hypothetical protein
MADDGGRLRTMLLLPRQPVVVAVVMAVVAYEFRRQLPASSAKIPL